MGKEVAVIGYADAPSVDLVGHSMGGLIIAGFLARRGREARVRKVVTLGTPFGGSFEAVLKITTGTSDLNEDAGSSREREVARVTPSLYHLLPSFAGGVIAPRGVPNDLFDMHAWQPSIAETIAEYIRLHGLDPRKTLDARLRQAREIFQRMLDGARAHRERIGAFALDSAGLTDDDWLCVAGLGEETRVRIKIEMVDGAPCFDLRSADRLQGYPHGRKNPAASPTDTGDGTVPFPGAIPSFLSPDRLVCVTGDDFGYWELRDRGLGMVASLHALLARMNVVHRLITAFLSARQGKPAEGNRSIWGRSAPGVSAWKPPFIGLRRKQ
jgi:pimeloyl-ACP methyl ester carboxylesterase